MVRAVAKSIGASIASASARELGSAAPIERGERQNCLRKSGAADGMMGTRLVDKIRRDAAACVPGPRRSAGRRASESRSVGPMLIAFPDAGAQKSPRPGGTPVLAAAARGGVLLYPGRPVRPLRPLFTVSPWSIAVLTTVLAAADRLPDRGGDRRDPACGSGGDGLGGWS
jgi:hypothetical protein